jgi:hypothetical protein
METEREKELLSIVNASGFVFQLGLAKMIESERQIHGWRVIATEHHWIDSESGTEGYIDIILQKQGVQMAVECKRLRGNAEWVFLITNEQKLRRTRLLWTFLSEGKPLAGWSDFHTSPDSYESAFCAVRGRSDKSKPMLERVTDLVLSSAEGLAEQGFQLRELSGSARCYIPVIVTNAKLEVCVFDPQEVDIQDGSISEGEFTTVPVIRFRKGLSTRLPTVSAEEVCWDIADVNKEGERTVFVANASSFTEFLRDFEIGSPVGRRVAPWNDLTQQWS